MTHHPSLRLKAVELRNGNLTMDEIAARLALPRTTVYGWIKDLPIPETSREVEKRRRATAAMSDRCRRARIAAYHDGEREFPRLAAEPGFRDFVCMYIGEGYKRNRNQVAVGNSDPAVVVLANRWILRLARNPVKYAVQYHADQDVLELQRFWGITLDIHPTAVTLQRKSNSGNLSGRKWRSRWGVLTVRANDTMLRARLQAWMDFVRESWA